MLHRLYVMHALSPLHAGTGQGVGLIDLPIARERTTDHPLVPGSSVKGVLRDASRSVVPEHVDEYFGSANPNEMAASMIRVSDARVLAFPVRSDTGTFAWVTCPYILLRLVRDAGALAGFAARDVPECSAKSAIVGAGADVVDAGMLALDGLGFDASNVPGGALHAAIATLAFPDGDDTSKTWRGLFERRLVIVDDDTFTWFVTHGTDVRAHVRINPDTGTVAKGALWYEETLPSETILVGALQVGSVRRGQRPAEALAALVSVATAPLQVGGNATTGAGQVRLSIVGGGA